MSDIEKSRYIVLLMEILVDQKRNKDRLTNDNRRLTELLGKPLKFRGVL